MGIMELGSVRLYDGVDSRYHQCSVLSECQPLSAVDGSIVFELVEVVVVMMLPYEVSQA